MPQEPQEPIQEGNEPEGFAADEILARLSALHGPTSDVERVVASVTSALAPLSTAAKEALEALIRAELYHQAIADAFSRTIMAIAEDPSRESQRAQQEPGDPNNPIHSGREAVINKAIEVIGDEKEALRWLGTPVRALNYSSPISRLDDSRGQYEVLKVLTRLEHGVL